MASGNTDPHSDEARRPSAAIVLIGIPLMILVLIVGAVFLAMKIFG